MTHAEDGRTSGARLALVDAALLASAAAYAAPADASTICLCPPLPAALRPTSHVPPPAPAPLRGVSRCSAAYRVLLRPPRVFGLPTPRVRVPGAAAAVTGDGASSVTAGASPAPTAATPPVASRYNISAMIRSSIVGAIGTIARGVVSASLWCVMMRVACCAIGRHALGLGLCTCV